MREEIDTGTLQDIGAAGARALGGIQIGGHKSTDTHPAAAASGEGEAPPAPIRPKRKRKASGEGAKNAVSPIMALPLAATVDLIGALQKRRTFCIKMQNRINNATGAFVRSLLGWRADLPEKEGEKIRKQAASIVKAIESGGEDQGSGDTHRDAVLSAATPIVFASAQSRAAFDAMRNSAEKEMRRLATTLPVYPWAKAVHGFGGLGLAVIVAETAVRCSDDVVRSLDAYSNPAKVWKRLGLAVINGERQRKKTNAEEAAAHGYSPRRRAEMYAVIGDPLFRAQSVAVGPYRADYDRRRLRTAETHPDWTKGHSHNDATRYMTKSLLRDLWAAWRAANDRLTPKTIVPPAEPIAEA